MSDMSTLRPSQTNRKVDCLVIFTTHVYYFDRYTKSTFYKNEYI